MDLGLDGRVCVVTGASRGIGLAVSRRLVAEGARVLMVARDEERLARAAAEVAAARVAGRRRDRPRLRRADRGDRGRAARRRRRPGQQRGDVVARAAGGAAPTTSGSAQHELNVMAPMRLMRLAAPRMAERGWGRIVNVSSSSGKRPGQSNVAYSVAKAGQLSLSRAFADAYAARGVLVNAVTPGPVATELWVGDGGLGDQAARAAGTSREEALAAAAKKVPLGRLGEPRRRSPTWWPSCAASARGTSRAPRGRRTAAPSTSSSSPRRRA